MKSKRITNACEAPGRWLSHYNHTPWSCFIVCIKLCSGKEGRVSFLVQKGDEADSRDSAINLIILLNNSVEFSFSTKNSILEYSLSAKAVVKLGLRSWNLLGEPSAIIIECLLKSQSCARPLQCGMQTNNKANTSPGRDLLPRRRDMLQSNKNPEHFYIYGNNNYHTTFGDHETYTGNTN